MQWCSVIVREQDHDTAVSQASSAVQDALGDAPDLVFVFASGHFQAHFEVIAGDLKTALGGLHFGCSGSGVIGDATEVEVQAALSVTAACLPDVTLDAWHLEADDLRPGSVHSTRCAELATADDGAPGQLLVLADPFTFPAEQLLRALESAFSRSEIAGGLASGGQAPGEMALFLDGDTYRSGATILALGGNIEMLTTVAQGCRPIGEPMFVSASDGNQIMRLDDQSPLAVLSDLYEAASESDQRLMQHSLFLGLGMRAGESVYERGDYLIRNLVRADQDTGALWVAADVHPNQVVQFHLRDAQTSAEDLDLNLARLAAELGEDNAAGGLLFSCTGRGRGLYGVEDHDSRLFSKAVGAVPLGGFFCNGEIGPVAGVSYVHGYTSAFAVFRPRS